MKVSIFGSTGTNLCQIPSLIKGFEMLGHEHTDNVDDSAFVFIGNPPFEKYLDLVKNHKVIFNVLDIPHHCPEVKEVIDGFRKNLHICRSTCISKTVKNDLTELCNIDSSVIYYPMKDVYFTGVKKYPYKVLLCGRVNDPNKRTRTALTSLHNAGYTSEDIAIVGGENPGWGTYLGIVTDEVLNDLYNSVDYVMMLSRNEGIGLPAIEGAICGAIPIVLPDLSTFEEFWIESPLGLHYQLINSINDISNLIMMINHVPEWKDSLKKGFIAHANTYFRPLFDKVEVAKRIISVYHTI